MAMKEPDYDTDPDGIKFRMKAAVALLGIYTAMYVAIAGVVRFVAPPEAVAAGVPRSSMAASAAATAEASPAGSGEAPAGEAPGYEAESTDNSRN
jgi:hypothetical protein